jgi:CHAT domain-containing protein
VRAGLREEELLLEYLVGPEGCALIALCPAGARFVELAADEAGLAARIAELLDPIEELRSGRLDLATLGFDARAAEELHRLLLDPVRAELERCSRLWIVPDGPLRRLPFGLLVGAREKRPVDPARLFAQYEGCRFLVEERALAHLPSAGLIVAGARVGAAAGRDSSALDCLVLADPSPMPSGSVQLAWARAEARAVADGSAGGVRLLLGPEASEQRFRELGPGARVLHLATHGQLDDRRPAFSRLALAPDEGQDGWLHAHEVEGLALGAERVVLSACETLGQAGNGEGLLGLSRAFLQAGARSVVAAAWPVDDQATAELMEHYRRALAAGETPIAALRTAQVALLRGPGREGMAYAHPYFWGAFQHLGPE